MTSQRSEETKIYDQLGFYSDNIDPATADAYASRRRDSLGLAPPTLAAGFPEVAGSGRTEQR